MGKHLDIKIAMLLAAGLAAWLVVQHPPTELKPPVLAPNYWPYATPLQSGGESNG